MKLWNRESATSVHWFQCILLFSFVPLNLTRLNVKHVLFSLQSCNCMQLKALANRDYVVQYKVSKLKSKSKAHKYMCSSDRRPTLTLRLGSGCMIPNVLSTIWNSHLKSKHFPLSVQADCPAPRSPSHVGIFPAPASVFHVPSLIQRWEPLLRM